MSQEGEKNLVSVVVPFFNPGHAICETIESILNQTYESIELILIDDGSTDSTCSEISRYLDFEGVHLYRNQFAKGQSGASNYGIFQASGAYIKFVDAADWLSPEHIELCVEVLASRDRANDCFDVALVSHDIVTAGGELIERHESSIAGPCSPPMAFANLMNGHEMLAAWKWFIPREAFTVHKLTWDEELSRNKDFVFSSDLLKKCRLVIPVTRAVYYYVKTPNSEGKQAGEAALYSLIAAHRKGIKGWKEEYLSRAFDLRLRKLQQYIYSHNPELAESLENEIQIPDKFELFEMGWKKLLARLITWRRVRKLGIFKRRLQKFFTPFDVPSS